MYIVILADEIGDKLWPVTADDLPKCLIPVYSESTLLEETIMRYSAFGDHQGINFILVIPEAAAENLEAQKTLEVFKIPEENIITVSTSKGSAWSMWLAIRDLLDAKNVSPDEQVIFTPADHFFWPKELVIFHLINMITHLNSHGDDCVALSLSPTKPISRVNYLYGDWNKVTTVNVPYVDDVLGQISTLGAYIEELQIKPDLETAKGLSANSWLIDLGVYFGKVTTFEHYLKKMLPTESKYWDSLDAVNFSVVLPEMVRDKRLFSAIIPKIMWERLDNWVAIRRLLYESGLFQYDSQPDVHTIDSERNLTFKPPGKTIVLYGISDLIVIDTGDKLLIGTPGGLDEYF